MVFDWVLLVVGILGSVYVFVNARRPGGRSRRGSSAAKSSTPASDPPAIGPVVFVVRPQSGSW